MPIQDFRTLSRQGFTLVEICIAVGLVSILTLALVEVNLMSAMATQSSNAADEFNNEASLLLNLLNANGSMNGITNGCTAAFYGMPLDASGNPIISPVASDLPSPSPSTAFNAYIATATAAIGIYTHPSSLPSPVPQGLVIQVTAPSAQTATGFFPPPQNHLWVTRLAFTQNIDPDFMTSYNHPGWFANLYNLHLDAQKISTGQKILGGETTYSKDFLVTLWVLNGVVQYCGANPP